MSTNIKFYLRDGTPDGADQLTEIGIRLIPYLQSISPNSGSYAGTTITAKLMGVGVNTAAVNVALSSSTSSICSSVMITSYGVVECTTMPGTGSTSSTLRVSVGSPATFYTCETVEACSYSLSATQPTVTSVINDKFKVTFNG